MPGCKEYFSKRYSAPRKVPPFVAADCRGDTKLGTTGGKTYKSLQSPSGVMWRWNNVENLKKKMNRKSRKSRKSNSPKSIKILKLRSRKSNSPKSRSPSPKIRKSRSPSRYDKAANMRKIKLLQNQKVSRGVAPGQEIAAKKHIKKLLERHGMTQENFNRLL